MQHLDGNVDTNLRGVLPPNQWIPFKNDFWTVYRAISPEDFDTKWQQLTGQYPAAQRYLDEELYPCRRQWAWVYVSHKFTCGVRTNRRVEVENRITKAFAGPKKSLKELFDGLNERTDGQSLQETLRVRDVRPLQLVRQFTAPFALLKCYEEMEQSMYYRTRVLQRPDGMRDWSMMNSFRNDNSHISTVFMLRLIRGRGLKIKHLVEVTHIGTNALHIVALLPDDNYICDCCMGMSSGLPCRHYFQVLSAIQTLKFNLGIIRPRYSAWSIT
ncbi:hypothetical protein GALMADRAFT_63504 [Galerina marginata CBS 339.88]|uniref:SWIM-type domain-containing protein n=1 Tax=Galerina marginata (strain CBS 339.88) TaxID=685588 RepID=A0A067T8Z8_GALM3|nr:hypothetical protein GALMADRAFT_63504 [Galerina marginata CBS 339.88]